MKQRINEIKRMQQLAGILNQISFEDFEKKYFNDKRQYIFSQKDEDKLFNDITNEEFIKILRNYPSLTKFIVSDPEIIKSKFGTDIKNNEEYLTTQDQKILKINSR